MPNLKGQKPAKASAARANFSFRKAPELEHEYKTMAKIVSEHKNRHLDAMYSPKHYNEDVGGVYDSKLAKDAIELVKAEKVLGDMWLKIQKQAVAEASLMSFEERVGYFLDWLTDPEEVGRINRRKAIKMIWAALHAMEQEEATLAELGKDALRDKPDPEDPFHFTPAEKAADAADDESAPESWEGDDGLTYYEVSDEE